MTDALTIHHSLGDVVVTLNEKVNRSQLKKMIRSTLDQYRIEHIIPASAVHAMVKARHGASYQTPGYHLRLYRQRKDLTQAALAKKAKILQHHLSEMENNRRSIGKAMARKLAAILDCDYRKFL